MTLVGTIDATGIHTPTYPEILEDLQARYRSIYGADLYLEADSQEGQMLAMFALALHDANQLAVSVYNSFGPSTAQGVGLSSRVQINGIARQTASYSTVDVTLTGTAGTVITAGVVEDVAGQKWALPATVVIPVTGEITVTATAQEAGSVQAAAGEVRSITTPTRGWQSVTNATAATPGTAVESDAALRSRQRVSTALPSWTVLDGIVGAVASLPGVTRFKGYENDDDVADENGIPAHALAIVVEGGNTEEITRAIATKKTPGSPTYGTTSATVTDRYGMPNLIRFFRPGAVSVTVIVEITARAGYISTTGETIKTNLAAYLNTLDIGEDVLLSKLYTPINAAEPDSTRRTFDVTGLTIAKHGGTPAASNIAIAFNEVAGGDAGDITLTVN
ncbi:MAG: baseplate J/gp47 family protein [Desulfovibrionaceae bacterium]|nr:baseplate J/gp47 family protein [Desulfovibrionaceae bacterium]